MTKDTAISDGTITGAAVAAGTAGILVAGPTIGVAAGAATAYAAANDEGAAGEVARATGQAAVELWEQEQKEHRVQKAAEAVLEDAQELNRKHRVVERTKAAAKETYVKVVAYEEKHQIWARVKQSVGAGAKFMVNKLQECTNKDTTT